MFEGIPFSISLDQAGRFLVKSHQLPEAPLLYLEDYLQAVNRYKNAGSASDPLFSLYQPPLLSHAGHRALHHRLKRRFERARIPASATIGMSRHCQCHCLHCSASYHMASAREDLTTDQMVQAFRESVDAGVTTLILVGGEPLIRRDLEKILEKTRTDRASVIAFSNGELLTEKRASSLRAAGLLGIFISLDSPEEKEHNELRGRPGLFEKAMRAIAAGRSAGLMMGISSYLTDERVQAGYVEKFMDLAAETKAMEVTFFDAIATGRLKDGRHTFLSDSVRLDLHERVRRFQRDPLSPAISAQSTLTSRRGSAFCFAGNTQFYLSSNGAFCPCDFTPLHAGYFPEFSIAALWKKLVSHPCYRKRSRVCRMQDPGFRRAFIDTIPHDAVLPYPLSP
ncbi:MAG: radical SAM protein [Spirochaetales bacterium]|nr:radical SAM protein [Spirochaetales bacterium]